MNLRSSESSPQIAPLDETIKEMCVVWTVACQGGYGGVQILVVASQVDEGDQLAGCLADLLGRPVVAVVN